MNTKIRLKEVDQEQFGVRLNGQHFGEILHIVKEMPVRHYDKNNKFWTIPCRDLAEFLMVVKKISGLDIKADSTVKQKYYEFLEWKKFQLSLKNGLHSDNEIVDQFRKELNADSRLFPFQIIGSYFLYKAKDGMLCDMVGLGKSIQSLTAVDKHMDDKSINFCIIICPSTLKRNWEQEIQKWTSKTCIIIDGTPAQRKKQYKQAYKYDYMIINYDLLNFDMNVIDEMILQKGYVYALIMDEIQYIKNYQAKRSKHTKIISRFAKYSIGMSATAIENSVLDLWSIFQAIDFNIFGDNGLFWHFKDKFIKMDWFGNAIGYKDEQTIKKRMAPFLLRRLKEDVLDELPDRMENNYWVELSPIQRKFYNDVSNQIVTEIEDESKAEKIKYATVLPMITYLRQCVLSAKLVGHHENISTKTDQLIDFLESLDDKSKVVLFTHFVGMVELLKETLDKYKYKNICIHGQQGSPLYCPTNNRVKVIDEFNKDDNCKILVTSDILTEGVNITSANYIVNFDMLFNPAKMEQRVGRIDRLGTKHKVINIVNIIAINTIEEDVFKTVWEKRNMSVDIMDDNKVENRLTIRNIKQLLELHK